MNKPLVIFTILTALAGNINAAYKSVICEKFYSTNDNTLAIEFICNEDGSAVARVWSDHVQFGEKYNPVNAMCCDENGKLLTYVDCLEQGVNVRLYFLITSVDYFHLVKMEIGNESAKTNRRLFRRK